MSEKLISMRQRIIEAARQHGVTDSGMEHPDRQHLGISAAIVEMEWGYWVGTSVYVSKKEVLGDG